MPVPQDSSNSKSILEKTILNNLPKYGISPDIVVKYIKNMHNNQTDVSKNTATYCNVTLENLEQEILNLGQSINIADTNIYKSSVELEKKCVNIIADLWHCPKSVDSDNYAGTNTVGSTEAVLLAGITLKTRWREWYCNYNSSYTSDNIHSVIPNIVISSKYQAAWEKLFKYFDIEPRIIHPTLNNSKIDPNSIEDYIDEKTIGVVAIFGDHYSGHYDPVFKMNTIIENINKKYNYQICIHVDAASGGFIAPFQNTDSFNKEPWDFRNKNVLSISTSGHKFGESTLGSGWLILRDTCLLKYMTLLTKCSTLFSKTI